MKLRYCVKVLINDIRMPLYLLSLTQSLTVEEIQYIHERKKQCMRRKRLDIIKLENKQMKNETHQLSS